MKSDQKLKLPCPNDKFNAKPLHQDDTKTSTVRQKDAHGYNSEQGKTQQWWHFMLMTLTIICTC